MSLYVYDLNGYLGDAASISGWASFVEWGLLKGGEVTRLTSKGISDKPAQLVEQLRALYSPDPGVESIRVGLLSLAGKAEDCVIISEGEEG